MPQLYNLGSMGTVEIPDAYTEQDTQDALILTNLNNPNFSPLAEEVAAVDRLLTKMKEGQLAPPVFTPASQEVAQVSDQDRTYLGEILAGLRSGAQFAVGSGLSGIERIAERVGLDTLDRDWETS